MKKIGFALLCSFVWFGAKAQTLKQTYENTINQDDLRTYLTYIASDELEGRDTGSEGQKKAADYIISHLKEWGVQPIVSTDQGKSYLQKFNLYQSNWGEAYLKVKNRKFEMFKDYVPSGFVYTPEEISLNTVFVGYGRKDDNFDDYKGLDVKGKAVVFLSGGSKEGAEDWNGTGGLRRKFKVAGDLGAAAVFEISTLETDPYKTMVAERNAILKRYSRMTIEQSPEATPSALPAFTVSKEMGAALIKAKPKAFLQYLSGKRSSLKTKSVDVKIKSDRGNQPVETANVLGFIEGTDKKDEVLVISAHYDHVGIDDKGEIYNGADDDGSGTCAVLEIAQAFAKAKKDGNGPRRSILFLWVTGEEKGLLGSEYFTDHQPIIPLDKIICDLNIDMIGRVDKKHEKNPDYTYIIGSDKLSSELHTISENANKESVNLELDYEFNDPKDPNRFYYRSDHYNFAKNKIPVAFYFTGVHEDYHKPGDDVEKIVFPRYTKVTRLVFNTAWDLVQRDNRIVVDSNKP